MRVSLPEAVALLDLEDVLLDLEVVLFLLEYVQLLPAESPFVLLLRLERHDHLVLPEPDFAIDFLEGSELGNRDLRHLA